MSTIVPAQVDEKAGQQPANLTQANNNIGCTAANLCRYYIMHVTMYLG